MHYTKTGFSGINYDIILSFINSRKAALYVSPTRISARTFLITTWFPSIAAILLTASVDDDAGLSSRR